MTQVTNFVYKDEQGVIWTFFTTVINTRKVLAAVKEINGVGEIVYTNAGYTMPTTEKEASDLVFDSYGRWKRV